MSSKDIEITCIWTTDGFVVVDNKTKPAQYEASLKISEIESKITVHIPKEYSLINKKIIERHVQSIAKSGFAVPNSNLRIGGGFEVEVKKHEEIPSILLQEGHKYSYDEFSDSPSSKSVTTVVEETVLDSESEYIPSFLKHDEKESDYQIKSEQEEEKITQEVVIENEEKTSERLLNQKLDVSDLKISDILAGKFIIALSVYGDIFFSRNGPNYSVDFSHGKVEFYTENGKITILRTERISQNHEKIQSAIETATKE